MRIACLDYLVGSMDRHWGNFLYDPVSMKCHGIDNGFSFGMATDVDYEKLPHPEGTTDSRRIGHRHDEARSVFDATSSMISVPMEFIKKHPHLMLDKEARGRLGELLKAIQSHGNEASLTKKLFRMLFPNQKIALVEEDLFVKRLQSLAEHGRPPMSEISPYLFPQGMATRGRLEKEEGESAEIQENREARTKI